MEKARYIRVSTINQKIERQLARQYSGEHLYIDRVSGSIPFTKRVAASELLKDIKPKSIRYISVSSIDRLGRNALDVLQTLEFLEDLEICVRVDNLGLESRASGKINPTFKLLVSVLANISEMERESLLERQKEGIALAKAKGIYKGRDKGTIEPAEKFLKKYPEVIAYLNKGKHTILEIAKLCDCSKNTVLKVKSYQKDSSIT